jgi:hypothetical protein
MNVNNKPGSPRIREQWCKRASCATCAQLNFTEKGLRKMMEMAKSFRHALANPETLDTFKARAAAASASHM